MEDPRPGADQPNQAAHDAATIPQDGWILVVKGHRSEPYTVTDAGFIPMLGDCPEGEATFTSCVTRGFRPRRRVADWVENHLALPNDSHGCRLGNRIIRHLGAGRWAIRNDDE